MANNLKQSLFFLLRKSEKYTKTDMVYLVQGGFWLTAKKVLAAAIALALSIAFANLLPQHVFGEYKYVFAIFGLLSIPTLLGMGEASMRAVAQGFEGTPKLALKTKIVWGFLGSLASVGIGAYYFLQGNVILGNAFILVSLFLPFVDTLSIFNTILTGKKLFRTSIFYEIGVQMFGALSVIVALLFSNKLLIILSVYFVAYTLARLVAYTLVIKKHTDNNEKDLGAISYGKHLSVMRVIGVVAEQIDNLLIWHFAGAVPLAIYSFAKAVPTQIRNMMASVPTMAFPKFAQKDFKSIKKPLVVKLIKIIPILLLIVGAYILAAPYVYAILFPQYTEAVFFSQLLALSLLFFPKKLMGTVFNAHADKRALYIISTVTPIVKLALTIILIPLYGILGAVIAEIGVQAFSFSLITFLFVTKKA